jgi:hypothetical protein
MLKSNELSDIHLSVRLLVMMGSTISIGFGIWHFSVPKAWNWYSYIDTRETELIVAVRAINVFFSLTLILFGIMNMLYGMLAAFTLVSLCYVISLMMTLAKIPMTNI